MKEIMKVEGSNRYKTPHMKRGSKEKNCTLPKNITCEYMLIEHVMNKLATVEE